MNPINRASIKIFERYIEELKDHLDVAECDYFYEICHEAIKHPDWPVDKMSRWLGFVQGGLVLIGFIKVDEEREITRPLFHEAYKELGIEIPKSVTVK